MVEAYRGVAKKGKVGPAKKGKGKGKKGGLSEAEAEVQFMRDLEAAMLMSRQ